MVQRELRFCYFFVGYRYRRMSGRNLLSQGSVAPQYTKDLQVNVLRVGDLIQADNTVLPRIQSGVSTCQAAQLDIQVQPYTNAGSVGVFASYFSTSTQGLSTAMVNVSTLQVTGETGLGFSWLTAGF